MCRARVEPARRSAWAVLGLAALCTIVTIADPAAARHRRHHRTHALHSEGYRPPYAAFVVDANSGQVLHADNADSLRHPASLTKIMTLYLLFEQLEAGRLKLNTSMEVSAHAASQAPTKLGLRPGQSLAVEDAIKGLVTKSANDAAVVIAEKIAGDENEFAKLMTRKAHALGMTRTVYANASGLPDSDQLTTARDQAILGRAIQDRFPRYYHYFGTPSFRFHGVSMRNHNHLLGNVPGVDGIKTGYTRDSGFNLVTSVRRGNRHLVAVVLGGSSGAARDARMRALIEEHVGEASVRRTAPMIAEAAETDVIRAKPRGGASEPSARSHVSEARVPESPSRTPMLEAPSAARSDATRPVGPAHTRGMPRSAEPIQPIVVKTIAVKASGMKVADLAPLVVPAPQSTVPPAQWSAFAATRAADAAIERHPTPARDQLGGPAHGQPESPIKGARPGILGVSPAPAAAVHEPDAAPVPTAAVRAEPARLASAAPIHVPTTPASRVHAGGWVIQVGAFPDEGQAKERLRIAQSMAQSRLEKADPFTEHVTKGEKEYYRARFAGFDRDGAEALCRYFKRNDIACMVLKN
jgi:D-alanyl-D-alanine carboxypeptidase